MATAPSETTPGGSGEVVAGQVRRAVEEAWATYGGKLYFFALSLVHGADDAEDVLQNVFLGLVRTLGREGEVRQLKAYLYQATRNEAWRLIRSRRDHPAVDVDDVPLMVEARTEDAGRALDVSRALAKLPPEQREVLVLKLWHDMTFDEVAGLTGVSLNTAASRYRYAVEKLRRVMGPSPEEP